MSWDREIRSVVCPCGNGTVDQEIRSDDWGRFEAGTPRINCDRCSKNYKLITITWTSPFNWKGGSSSHFLVPVDLDVSTQRISRYCGANNEKLGLTDFQSMLVEGYTKGQLADALAETDKKTSVSSLGGIAKKVADRKRKGWKTAKISDLRSDIRKAISVYDSYVGNCIQLEEEKEINRKIQSEFNEKVEKEGTLLDL